MELSEMMSNLQGMISLEEAEFLYDLAAAVTPPDVIVEVGSYRGKSTCALSWGAFEGGSEVFAIDPHKSFTGVLGAEYSSEDRMHFYQAMLTYGAYANVSLINLTSNNLKSPFDCIGLLFVDGDHRYEAVLDDVENFRGSLSPGAVVAFDDCDYSGVRSVIDNDMGDFDFLQRVGKIEALKYTP